MYQKSGLGASKSMPTTLKNRGKEIFFSDPWREDSDLDGVLDGDEVDWDGNYDEYSSATELIVKLNLGYDHIPNVRDPDSDNDGILDGDEVNFDEDESGLGLDTDSYENMIDYDSDGDGLWDNNESATLDDDSDGLVSVVDPDSDNDGLCDGYVGGYIWDPNEDTYYADGWYVTFATFSSTYSTYDLPTETSGFDKWEGEDEDWNGLVEEETDPADRDTDDDKLRDGYDYYNATDDEWYYGELYFNGFNERLYNGSEQDDDCDPLDDDTDGDTLDDGFEVYGWLKEINVTKYNGYVLLDDITSDPTLYDTDGDGLRDNQEHDFDTDPQDYDTDDDGLHDYKEYTYDDTNFTNQKSKGNHWDSDSDNLPDGYIDGWYRADDGSWGITGSTNGIGDPWEGEDIDLNGIRGTTETSAVRNNSDAGLALLRYLTNNST